MAKRRTKSSEQLKAAEQRGRNFNVAEITFIKANAPTMTVKQLAEALNATESEVETLIKQYNEANMGTMVKQSFLVGKDRMKGVVIATPASSELGDKNNGMTGPMPDGNIKPVRDQNFIFRTKPGAY